MGRSLDLNVILSQPHAHRNADWEKTLFLAMADGRIHLEGDTPKAGPDGWPYMFARSSPAATEPAVRLIDWLSTRGIGLVLNAHKDVPDYIFTYGMLWNFKERHEFITPQERVETGKVEFKIGENLTAGIPSQSYLPEYVRAVLAEFFKEQGAESPRVLMLSKDGKHYDLCVSVESLGDPPAEEHKDIAEALAWFLPQHYSVVIISEKSLPEFAPLVAD